MNFFKKYYIRYLRNRGQKLLKKGKTEKAERIFAKILQFSKTPEDFFNYGLSLMDLFDYEGAIEYFKKVNEKNPNFPMNNIALGEAYLLVRDWDNAKEIFTHLLEKYPDSGTFKNYISIMDDVLKREKYVIVKESMAKAVSALRKRNNIKAIEHLKFAEDVAPEIPMIKNSLGEIYFLIKDYDNAFEYFKKAIEIEPENPKFQNNWKKILRYKK